MLLPETASKMIWIVAVLLLSLTYLLHVQPWPRKKKTNERLLPPGPRGFPILGSLHLLGSHPHRALHRLALNYGPIMYLRLGMVPTIVVSSPQAAQLFLKTHDLVFASRPSHEAIKHLCWGHKCLSFSPYGSYWRNMRKICTLELLSNLKINSFRHTRKEELDLLTKLVKEAAREGDAIDLTAKVSCVSADMSCRMIFGRKYMDEEIDERGFKDIIHEGMKLSATPYMGDYIPLVGALNFRGFKRRVKAVRRFYDHFFDNIIDEHVNCEEPKDKNTKDFVDILLGFVAAQEDSELRIGRAHIKATLLDMLAGSMDTSATAIDWTLSELMKHPRVMKKLQKEIETVVGMERTVEESDLEKLEYLDMVIKESLRLHPVAPLLLPHQSTEDCVVGEFFIPKNSRIIVNAWAVMRDPSAWNEAEKFMPERFEGTSIDIRGRDFQMIPFGSGRRGCPGMQLGLTVVRLVVAQLVHCFHWKLPDDTVPTELDMTEEFGLTAPRAKHLFAIPTYRLHI